MTRIAPVHLPYNPKTLWFDARDLELSAGDSVVVLTARGLELGRMAGEPFEASEEETKKLKSPLKPVKRVATDEDVAQAEELERKSREAMPVFRELAAKTSEEMHPVAVEFLLGGDKAVFYFEAENRIDFRELVHKLASRFHVRIDMRQIGVRDEARMIGGIGHCGQELCCKRLGGDFNPVSIRMAKEQDLSLNPQKISGLCGRLMCCLRYEYEAYKEFKSRAPKQNSFVDTPDGPAKVTSLDVPREIVTVRDEDGKSVKVPFDEMDPPAEDAQRRTVIGEEAWERAREGVGLGSGPGLAGAFSTSGFTGSDKLGEAKAVHHPSSKRKAGDGDQAAPSRRRRRRSTKVEGGEHKPDAQHASGASKQSGKKKASDAGASSEGAPKKKGMQPRRRSKQAQGKQPAEGRAAEVEARGAAKPKKQKPDAGKANRAGKPRPGQKSSGLSRERASRETASGEAPASSHRSSRRRSHKAGSASERRPRGEGRGDQKGGEGSREA